MDDKQQTCTIMECKLPRSHSACRISHCAAFPSSTYAPHRKQMFCFAQLNTSTCCKRLSAHVILFQVSSTAPHNQRPLRLLFNVLQNSPFTFKTLGRTCINNRAGNYYLMYLILLLEGKQLFGALAPMLFTGYLNIHSPPLSKQRHLQYSRPHI